MEEVVPVTSSTTFPSETYIKAVNVFSDNYAVVGFNFTGSNDDIQCVGDCRATYLKSTIAPGGLLNYISALINDGSYDGYSMYTFENITFNFKFCA